MPINPHRWWPISSRRAGLSGLEIIVVFLWSCFDFLLSILRTLFGEDRQDDMLWVMADPPMEMIQAGMGEMTR